MASGYTTTQALTDSLDTVVASARLVREQEGGMAQLVDKVTLDEGTGLSWKEVSYDKITAYAITETTVEDNPQQLVDSAISITPTMFSVHTVITDRVGARMTGKGFTRLGQLAQNSIQRKKDLDALVVLDGATTSLCGAGTTLTSGHIRSAVRRITSNATEPGKPPIHCVLHGYQVKDLEDELSSGIGTYPVTDGLTAKVFTEGFRGKIGGASIFEDGNITIDSSDDAKGGVFAKEGIVLVQGRAPKSETRREPHIGGGSTSVWLRDEYAFGERSAGNWLLEIYSDALAPTS